MPQTLATQRTARQRTLRTTLDEVLSGRYHRSSVQHLLDITKRMALAYLHTKARMGTMDPSRFGMSFEDMATDAVADLFARDDEGRFVELHAYFASTDWPKMSEVDAEIALRRIVFGKVSERLFRAYKENDPNLGKVIRNIKDAVGAHPTQHLERIGGRLWIITGDEEELANEKPVAPSDVLEAYVTSSLGRNGLTGEAIAALERFLEYHSYYRNGYPVSAFAKIVRSAFIRLGAAMVDDEQAPNDTFSENEVEDAIETAIETVRGKMFVNYVQRRKVDADTFEVYINTVATVLTSEYVNGTSSQRSHYDIMARHRPGLSKDAYRRTHRNRIEYMVKLARTGLSELLADDIAVGVN